MNLQYELDTLKIFQFNIVKLVLITNKLEQSFRNEIFSANVKSLLSNLVFIIRDAKKATDQQEFIQILQEKLRNDSSFVDVFKVDLKEVKNAIEFCEKIFEGLTSFVALSCGKRLRWYNFTTFNPLFEMIEELVHNFFREIEHVRQNNIGRLPFNSQIEVNFSIENFPAVVESFNLGHINVQNNNSLIFAVEKDIQTAIWKISESYFLAKNITGLPINSLEEIASSAEKINDAEAKMMESWEVMIKENGLDYFCDHFVKLVDVFSRAKADFLCSIIKDSFPKDKADHTGSIMAVKNHLRELYGWDNFRSKFDAQYGEKSQTPTVLPSNVLKFMKERHVKDQFTKKVLVEINYALRLPIESHSSESSLSQTDHQGLLTFKETLEELTKMTADASTDQIRYIR